MFNLSRSSFLGKRRNSSRITVILEGPSIFNLTSYGGLGERYFYNLSSQLDKIHQLDTVTGLTESNGTVRGRAIQLAQVLKKRNIKSTDIITLISKSHAYETIVVLAAFYIGAMIAPLNIETCYQDCLKLIKKLKPKIFFCDVRAVSQIERVLNALGIQREIIVFGSGIIDKIEFSSLFTKTEDPDFRPVHIEDPSSKIAFIMPTQGTCGPMKLGCISHNNVVIRTMLFLDIVSHPQKLISYHNLPSGFQYTIICAAFEEPMTRILPGTFTERSCCKLIHDLQIDLVLFSTSLARKFTRALAVKDFNLSCLKTCLVGGTMTTKDDMCHFRGVMPNVQFVQVYSSIETGCVSAIPIIRYQEAIKKPETVGKILPNVKVKIVDLETGDCVGPEKLGHVYVSGEGVMIGYFKNAKATLACMEKNYFKTGDIGRYDKEGWLYIEGRMEDVFVHDNEIFSSREIEQLLLSHSLVYDACVLVHENEMTACIIKRPDSTLTAEKLQTFVSERLPNGKRPSRYVFFEEFPRTFIGKTKRIQLREELFQVKIKKVSSFASMKANS